MKPTDLVLLSPSSSRDPLSSNLSYQNLSKKTVSFAPNVEVFSEKPSYLPSDLGPPIPGQVSSQPLPKFHSFRRSVQPLGGLADIPEHLPAYEPIQHLSENLRSLTGFTPLGELPLTPIAPIAGVSGHRSQRRVKKRTKGNSCRR